MSDFSDRLKEERERIGLTQEQMGEAGGVRKQAQHLYEKGERKPDAEYLMRVHSAGVDVTYLLTGLRGQAGATKRDAKPRMAGYETHYGTRFDDEDAAGGTVIQFSSIGASAISREDVCSMVIDALHSHRRTLPSEKVWAIVDSVMALQRGGISVDKSTIDLLSQAGK